MSKKVVPKFEWGEMLEAMARAACGRGECDSNCSACMFETPSEEFEEWLRTELNKRHKEEK